MGRDSRQKSGNAGTRTVTEKICVIPRVHGVGGMVSFLHKFSQGAEKKGVQVTQDPNQAGCSAMLVIGGTKDIQAIRRFRKQGRKVVQRLDGMNWIHKVRPMGFRHMLKAEYGNWIISTIRRSFADEIIYQSQFSKNWWDQKYGKVDKPTYVVYNGVNLSEYVPGNPPLPPPYTVLMVEGSLGGGYDIGLANAVALVNGLVEKNLPVELRVVGEVPEGLKSEWQKKAACPVHWVGKVSRQEIISIDQQAHVLFSGDIHPACPNSVLEALACGLPVVAYDTGSLAELVDDTCGRVASYGTNPWKLDVPDATDLVNETAELLQSGSGFSQAARLRAEKMFGLDMMVEKYLKVLIG